MRLYAATAVLALTVWTPAAAQDPDPDQAKILADARQTALNYSKWLPDFICSEQVHRFEAYGEDGAWRSVGTLTLQLAFFRGRENYTLIARNGRPTKQSLESVGGALTKGEFGSALVLIFDPSIGGKFKWREWASVNGHRTAVFAYHVDRATSHYELHMGSIRVIAGYHGLVYIEPEKSLVLRLTEEVEVPSEIPVQQSSLVLDYDFADVGGHQYLLPARSEIFMADLPPPTIPPRGGGPSVTYQMRYRNLLEFREYRKYTAESTLKFDGKLP
jgi:hypothetical protein